MSRFLVSALALLLGLLVVGRLAGPPSPAPPPAQVATPLVQRAAPSAPAPPATLPATSPAGGTPTIDLLARLEGRRRLLRSTGFTYFDSLFVETDSVVRHWPDRGGAPFLIAIPPSDSAQYDAALIAVTRRAAAIWEDARLGLRFTIVSDTSGAQIAVHGGDQLGGERAGQTDLQWTRDGSIQSAVITLARRDSNGRLIPDPGRLAVAVHEIGHAMGLAHSPNPEDVMFAATRTFRLSARDRATLQLLYELPLGTVREGLPQ